MQQLNGKTAFITGGASGIGFAMAQAFLREGMRVVITDVDADALAAAREALQGSNTEVLAFPLDVTDREAYAAVVQQAIYAPTPNQKDFQQTKAARFDKRDGTNKTSFCVDTNGKVVDVKTKTKFPGDPQVDKIIRDTIKKWRFKPFIVGGKPVKTCTERTFKIKFK